MGFQLLIIDLSACANGVLFRNSYPVPVILRLFPTFFVLIRFSVSGFMLRSLIHLELNFVQGVKYGFFYMQLPS